MPGADGRRKRKKPDPTLEPDLREQMQIIISRLTELEGTLRVPAPSPGEGASISPDTGALTTVAVVHVDTEGMCAGAKRGSPEAQKGNAQMATHVLASSEPAVPNNTSTAQAPVPALPNSTPTAHTLPSSVVTAPHGPPVNLYVQSSSSVPVVTNGASVAAHTTRPDIPMQNSIQEGAAAAPGVSSPVQVLQGGTPPVSLAAPSHLFQGYTTAPPSAPASLQDSVPTPWADLMQPPPPPSLATSELDTVTTEVTNKIVTAMNSLASVRTHNFYISHFDPSIHDIETWCDEVDQARILNKWSDRECLSRIGHCLRGDAQVWLNEWVSNDRTWTNFKADFKSLCPRKIDVANILFDVMKTDSDRYPTYAEYARRSLLRLRIVKGLSDELITAIVVRGIVDAQIRAVTANARLLPNELVNFLSVYLKPKTAQPTKVTPRFDPRKPHRTDHRQNDHSSRRRERPDTFAGPKCFSCGKFGHKQLQCPKRAKMDDQNTSTTSNVAKSEPCTFCKKPGHKAEDCFAKQRSESRGKSNVNFCREIVSDYKGDDIATAVIQGIPVDVLIDSGSTISLISDSVLKHFDCKTTPQYRILQGIGKNDVESTRSVTLALEFAELTIDVELYVVSHAFMTMPFIIGTDVLNRDGVVYIRKKGNHRLTRVDPVNKIDSHVQVINTPLVGTEKNRLLEIIDEFSEHLITGTASSTVKTGAMQIRLSNDTPICYRPYKLSHEEKLRVRDIIRDLLEKGIIRESESAYSSPILLVKKKDGSDRLCVDYRALNAVTVKDRYPLPLIEDHIDRLGKSRRFSSLDMATGFHQIPMDDGSIHITGFVTPEGHFEYLKMPYGLANAPVVYQRIISNTLRTFIESGKVLVYIDDVLILSMTIEEGLQTLREVLSTLTGAGFSINLKKCSFLATEVEYLGRTISNGQVKPSARKVEALVNSPIPKNVKQVRQFLGLAGYFRRYIPNYASRTACISRLTRKETEFLWGDEQEKARQDLINHMTDEPVLAIFDPSLPTEVHTDASAIGYGAILMQVHDNNKKKVIAYFSQVTKGAEPRYHSYELETLAVVRALQHFRHYLIGVNFKVITDCNALKCTQRKKDLLPRVARWWIYLQDFNFELEYRKGVLLQHADYLSRNPVSVCEIKKPQTWAQIAQAADEETQAIIQKLDDGTMDNTRYVKRNDLLLYKYDTVGESSRYLCYVPKGHRLSLLRIFHDEHQHIGVEKTTDLILKYFWFPGLRKFTQKYISHCLVCISHKKVPRQPLQPIESWSKPGEPFHTIHTDVLGPLPDSNGFRYVLLIIDAFTKYCLLYPMYRQDAAELQRIFTNAVSLFGTPKLIVADRGRMYESSTFVNWVADLGSQIYFITPAMHQSNGQVERYVRSVLNMIRIEHNFKQEKWSETLWKLQLTINLTKQKTTQCSPLNLLIGSEAVTPVIRALVRDLAIEGSSPNRQTLREVARQRASDLLERNRADQDASVNKNRKVPRPFSVNDMVFVRKDAQAMGKLDSCMRGPYRVLKVLPHDRYQLRLMAGSFGKTTEAAATYMTLWRGEWTPDVCSAYFDCEYWDMLRPLSMLLKPDEISRGLYLGEYLASTPWQEAT